MNDEQCSALRINEAFIDLHQLSTTYDPHFLSERDADHSFKLLENDPYLKQDRIRMMGQWIQEPRLTAWYGDPDKSYKYSGKIMVPKPWTPILLELKHKIEHRIIEMGFNVEFNSVLINKYRNGLDSQGWHSDDEKELGPDPVIASLSLGATRTFQIRLKDDHSKKISASLLHGSLLVMSGRSQSLSQHRVPKINPKNAAMTPSRINLTFRTIR